MDTFKKRLSYWRMLRNSEIDHGDILAYRLAFILRKFLLWLGEEVQQVPIWTQVVYMLLSIRMTTGMGLSLVYLGMHWNLKPLSLVLQDVAICVAGFLGSTAPFVFHYYRKRTSKLLRVINEFNLDVLKRNSLENRKISNRLFLSLSYFCAVLELLTLISFILFAWQFIVSGLPQFNSFLYQTSPYSLMAFVDEILFLVPGFWMMSLCTFYTSMYIEFFLRISFYFRFTSEEMRKLRRGVKIDEEVELKKLKSLIQDLNLLYWCVDECNETLRIYITLYFGLAFATFGVYAAVIMSIPSIMNSLHLLVFPLHLFLFVVTFCTIGQHLKDSAGEVEVGISDCDWYTAPIPFRKLVLNVLTRCTRETLFRASPFYDLDLLLLTRVLKTTYTAIAVFRKAIK